VNRSPVLQGNNPQESPTQLFYLSPIAIAIHILELAASRILNDANTPLLPQVWPLPENFLLKIFGESIIGHALKIRESPYHATQAR